MDSYKLGRKMILIYGINYGVYCKTFAYKAYTTAITEPKKLTIFLHPAKQSGKSEYRQGIHALFVLSKRYIHICDMPNQ